MLGHQSDASLPSWLVNKQYLKVRATWKLDTAVAHDSHYSWLWDSPFKVWLSDKLPFRIQSSHVVRTKEFCLWNQWANSFDLRSWSIWFSKVWIFRHLWPCTALIKVKVKGQGQGHIRRYFGPAFIQTWHEGSMTIRTWVMAKNEIYDVIVTSIDVVRAKKIYLWNQ